MAKFNCILGYEWGSKDLILCDRNFFERNIYGDRWMVVRSTGFISTIEIEDVLFDVQQKLGFCLLQLSSTFCSLIMFIELNGIMGEEV